MKKLIFYLKPYIKLVILAPLLMLFEVSAELIQPLLMASIVDYGIKTGDIVFIMRTGAIMIGVVIIGALGGVGSTICASFVSQNYGADLRMDLFKNIQAFSFTNIDSFKSSSLITRLTNDVVLLQNVIQSSLRIVLRAPIFIIGGLAIAFRINARLALIMVLIVPVIGLVSVIVMRKAFPMFKKVQRGLDKVNSVIQENLAGVKVVKAFMRMEFEKKRFNKSNEELMDSMIQATRLAAIILPLMILLMNLSIVAVVWFGGVQVNLGNMQVGEVLAFINYMTQILFSLMMVAFMLMFASRAKASVDRVIEVLETEPSINDNKLYTNEKLIIHGNICFKNVYFKYENKEVLTNINLNIKSGETLGIIGSTGTGKTTLVNLIARFYDVTSGEILIDGNNVKNIPLKQLRENISMVLQEPILFSGTIVENILWGRENASMDEVIYSTKMAQAHDFIEKFTEGYNTVLGQRGVNLSGGQKQRISIARALLKKPKILVLDDSTSAVDMITEVKILNALKEQLSDVTKIIIAQRISSIIEADKIVVLEQGSIVSIGSHKELVEHSAIYKEIYNSQIGEAVN
ncbi:ABC transporter ATP-binding protein [Serpentinicella alkaliphila]|uniref:ATP-binding cassette subfamily B protein n=1 Tax=Serpentinicella alkaliphila TaxID=1734049 RepID=A0A4R2TQK9_9FIRM|nr:ABC transporter ATP-binding protein [Serpentinicella alkaliphila]QUH25769.1 ABC transporter ATP-binding protein [Serpentinicella alkaliphila]TCP99768.1 ATP-binding cassette subfamily B protein [Serpentinicella alkaliphila]